MDVRVGANAKNEIGQIGAAYNHMAEYSEFAGEGIFAGVVQQTGGDRFPEDADQSAFSV